MYIYIFIEKANLIRARIKRKWSSSRVGLIRTLFIVFTNVYFITIFTQTGGKARREARRSAVSTNTVEAAELAIRSVVSTSTVEAAGSE